MRIPFPVWTLVMGLSDTAMKTNVPFNSALPWSHRDWFYKVIWLAHSLLVAIYSHDLEAILKGLTVKPLRTRWEEILDKLHYYLLLMSFSFQDLFGHHHCMWYASRKLQCVSCLWLYEVLTIHIVLVRKWWQSAPFNIALYILEPCLFRLLWTLISTNIDWFMSP